LIKTVVLVMVMILIGMVFMGAVTVTVMRAVTIVAMGVVTVTMGMTAERVGVAEKEEWMWVVDTSYSQMDKGSTQRIVLARDMSHSLMARRRSEFLTTVYAWAASLWGSH
jgi:cytochrome c biogenesis protein CcdA